MSRISVQYLQTLVCGGLGNIPCTILEILVKINTISKQYCYQFKIRFTNGS